MRGKFNLQNGLFALAILILPLGTIGLAPGAEAAIALDIVNANNGTRLGSIAFPATTGSSAQGVEFELNADGQVFTQDDITAVSWALDEATSEVVSLRLDASQGDDPCPNPLQVGCTKVTLRLTAQNFSTTTLTCPEGEPLCFASTGPGTVIDFIDPAPAYACVGFEPPLADGPVTVKGNRALPLKAELLDEDGIALTDADLGAAPVVQVEYHSGIGGTPEDVSDQALWAGQGSSGNAFVFSDGRWRFNLKVGNYSAPGTYVISMISGNGGEYRVDPTCEAEFVVNP